MNVRKYLIYSTVCAVVSIHASQDVVFAQQNNGRLIGNLRTIGKCIDVAGAPGTGNGALLQLFTCEFSGFNPNGTSTDQRWGFITGPI